MTTRAEFVQKARAAGLDDVKIKNAMADRRSRVGAFEDDPGSAEPALSTEPSVTAEPQPAQATPQKQMGVMDHVKEGLKYLIPSRMEYGEKHPGKNTIQGQVMGNDADPSFVGQSASYLEDASSLPSRLWGGAWHAAQGDLPGAKREMQKTEGDGLLQTVGRELPLMMIPVPGAQSRGGAAIGAKVLPKIAEAVEGALPLKALPNAAAAASSFASKTLGGLKRLGADVGGRIMHGAAQNVPTAAYHQAKSVQETGSAAPADGGMELAAGGLVQIPLKLLGGLSRIAPQGAKWLMSQFSGANQAALQRASEKGGLKALAAVSDKGAADALADELMTTVGNKADLLHPESQAAEEIARKLPPVQAVEPITSRNARAISNGKEIPIDMTGREPLQALPDNRPSLADMQALEKSGSPAEGLPMGNEDYASVAKKFKTLAADRNDQVFTLGQNVRKAMREAGPILVDDNLRQQLNLTGSNWKNTLSDYGLDMFTTDKKIGKTLVQAAMEIGEQQGHGRWDAIGRINNEGDLVNALMEGIGRQARKPDEYQRFLDQAVRTGENVDNTEKILAGSLDKGDFVSTGLSLFKVVKKADGEVILDGPTKLILRETDPIHIDQGSRMTAMPHATVEGTPAAGAGIAESMAIPPQAKVEFLQGLEQGRTRFRDILESKVRETVRTPEKEKTISKLNKLLDLADAQLQGKETLSATEAINFKRDYQEVLAEQYKSRDSNEYFKLYKQLAHSLRTGIEEAAEKSGNPEYITTMRSLANKMNVIDKVENRFIGEQLSKGQDKAARQIGIITNPAQRPAMKELQALDDLFGTNFTDRAKDISFSRMLGMSETGSVPLLPLHTTGKALMGASALGGAYKAKDGEINPMAVLGMMLSSPRLAIYAFKGLDAAGALKPAMAKLGPAISRLSGASVNESNKKEPIP
ncbi:MAG: hypothetical protein ABIY63_13335 [Fibrobacteria bacterium]